MIENVIFVLFFRFSLFLLKFKVVIVLSKFKKCYWIIVKLVFCCLERNGKEKYMRLYEWLWKCFEYIE